MLLTDIITTLINKVNTIICNVRNIQIYVGTADDTTNETLTGRIKQLEDFINEHFDENGKLKCEYLEDSCNINSIVENPSEW